MTARGYARAAGDDAASDPNRPIQIIVPATAGGANDIVAKLQDQIVRAVKLPQIGAKLRAPDIDPVGNTAAEFSRIVAGDVTRWTAVAKAAHLKLHL